MTRPVSELDELVRSMRPVLNPEIVTFCVLPPDVPVTSLPAIGMFREAEGTTVIVDERAAAAHGLAPRFRAAWITLSVHSDMHAVGLTATVAGVLAEHGISCNVVAAAHHDHLFVPAESGGAALALLAQLQSAAGRGRQRTMEG
jgi:hypothetical protein